MCSSVRSPGVRSPLSSFWVASRTPTRYVASLCGFSITSSTSRADARVGSRASSRSGSTTWTAGSETYAAMASTRNSWARGTEARSIAAVASCR
jgi:hypothetical protein